MSLREDLIYAPALLMDMSAGSVTLGVTFFASRLGASPLVIGAMASANTVLYVAFCQVFGKLSDRVERKRLPQIACLSLAVLYAIIPFCKQLYQLVVLFPLNGIGLAALWPALEAWIGERGDGRSLLKRVRMFNLSWTAGLMIGYVSGGYICDLNVVAPFYFSCALALCASSAITAQPGSARRAFRGAVDELAHELDTGSAVNRQLTLRYLYVSWASIFFGWLTLGVLRYIFPKFIDQLGMAPSVAGVIMLCQVSAQFLMFFILGTTERWHYKFKYLLVFQILGSLGFLLVFLSESRIIWAFGFMIIGLNTGMAYFSSMYYSLSGHADLGGKSGWHESILHSGALMSTLVGGALADYVSLKSPYLFCAAALIVGLPVQFYILRRNVRKRGVKQ
jgi:MFS family permease